MGTVVALGCMAVRLIGLDWSQRRPRSRQNGQGSREQQSDDVGVAGVDVAGVDNGFAALCLDSPNVNIY